METNTATPDSIKALGSGNTEFGFRAEADAKTHRRNNINLNAMVSLIAFDSARELYVYDVIK